MTTTVTYPCSRPLDRDAPISEPCNGPLEDTDRGDGSLVGMDLGIGDARAVVDHGVNERRADLPVALGGLAGPKRRRGFVSVALLLPDEPPAAPVRDVPELRHVHVDHRAGSRVLVAADRLSGDPVDVGKAVDAAPHQDGMHRRRR